MTNERNTKQDIKIAVLEEKIDSLNDKFEKFIGNDFNELCEEVKKLKSHLFWGFIVGIASLIITQIIIRLFL